MKSLAPRPVRRGFGVRYAMRALAVPGPVGRVIFRVRRVV